MTFSAWPYFCEFIPLLQSFVVCFQMIMDLNTMGLICDNPQVKGREYEEFMRKYRVLTTDELKAALRVDASDIFNVLNQSIPCVGCRRRYSIFNLVVFYCLLKMSITVISYYYRYDWRNILFVTMIFLLNMNFWMC